MNRSQLLTYGLIVLLMPALLAAEAIAQEGSPLLLERNGRVISLKPYAPNILRVTMSVDRDSATSAPGYGIVGTPSSEGWVYERDADGGDVFRSARMIVRVASGDLPKDKLPQPCHWTR